MKKGIYYGWITLAGAGLTYCVEAAVIVYPFGLFLPFISDEFGWSRGTVSVAPGLSYFLGALFTPMGGYLVAKYGARRCIVVGGTVSALAMLLMSFLTYLWQLYFAYGLLVSLGVALAGLVPATTLANNWFTRKRPVALGIITASGSVGALIFIPIVAQIIERLGWRGTYLVLFPLVLVLMAVLPGILIRNHPKDLSPVADEAVSDEAEKPAVVDGAEVTQHTPVDFTLSESIRTAGFWLLAASWGIVMFSMAMMITHTVAHLLDKGIAIGVAATIFSFLPGMSIVGKLGAGFLGLRINTRVLALGAVALMAVAMSILVSAKSVPLILAGAVCLGLGFGTALTSFLDCFPSFFGSKHNAKIIGTSLPITMILGGLGAPFAGFVYDLSGSYMIPFSTVIVLLTVAVVFVSLARPPLPITRRDDSAEIPGAADPAIALGKGP